MSPACARIVVLTADLPPRRGGVARYHAAVLAALGASAEVVRPQEDLHWLRSVLALLRRRRADFVLVGEVLPYGTVAWIASRVTRTPYAVICHGLDLQNAMRVPRKRAVARRVLRGAAMVIANSEMTAALARAAGAVSERIAVVPPPVGITPELLRDGSVEHLRSDHALDGVRIVLAVGRLIARKGFDTFLMAMAEVIRAHPDVIPVIAGDGPEREALGALANRLGVPVRWVHDADDATLAAWYAACDVFALLPRELPNGDVEGFGIVYLEAGAFGKPVVGTWSGGVPEAVADGVTGTLVPPDEPAAAAVAMRRLLEDTELAARLGMAGAERVRREFSREQFAKRLHTTLDPLCASR